MFWFPGHVWWYILLNILFVEHYTCHHCSNYDRIVGEFAARVAVANFESRRLDFKSGLYTQNTTAQLLTGARSTIPLAFLLLSIPRPAS